MPTDWLFRRQSPEDRAQQDAFLADIAAHWRPQTVGQRLLHAQSLAVHVLLRLFSGGPTLAPAALAALGGSVGTALLMVAVGPSHGQLDPGPPAWDYLLLTAALLGFAVQALHCPQAVRPWRLSLFFGVPMVVGSAVNASMVTMVVLSDPLYRVGMAVLSLGAAFMAVLPLVAARRRPGLLRAGMVIGGLGAIGTIVGDAQWAWLEAVAGNSSLGWGCAADTVGAAFLAITFLRARPTVVQ